MNFVEFKAQWSKLHNNASTDSIVGGWLWISFRLAQRAHRLKFTPNTLTLLGVLFSLVALRNSYVALIMVPFSLACDGIDGSLALIQKSDCKLGSLYDSLADRISEAAWAVIFYSLGAPLWAVLIFWTLGAVQEYARARLLSLNVNDLGVVTPMERPMRASALFIALVLSVLNLNYVNEVLYCALALQILSVLLVARFASQSLRQPSQR